MLHLKEKSAAEIIAWNFGFLWEIHKFSLSNIAFRRRNHVWPSLSERLHRTFTNILTLEGWLKSSLGNFLHISLIASAMVHFSFLPSGVKYPPCKMLTVLGKLVHITITEVREELSIWRSPRHWEKEDPAAGRSRGLPKSEFGFKLHRTFLKKYVWKCQNYFAGVLLQ